MKKVLTMFVMMVSFAVVAYADGSAHGAANDLKTSNGYGMAGCGLGSILFQSNTTVNQVLAATTNGTFGSQTFGITSGTSNCTHNGVAKLDKETEMFVEVNYDVLQKEISQGKGETLASFANLMGCDANVLGAGLQSNYSTLSTASDADQFLSNVRSTIKGNEQLSASCKI